MLLDSFPTSISKRGGPRYLSGYGKVSDADPVLVTFSMELHDLCQEEKQGSRKENK